MASVVKTVQELGGHEDFLLPHIFGRLAPRAVMLGLETVAVGPGIEHHALLRVELPEIGLQFVVKAALVTVTPEDNRRMVHVACYHLLHQLCAVYGLMRPVPSGQFAFHIKSQRVAGIQEFGVGGIVAQADGIHVHRLDEQHVLDILCLRERAACLRTERMAVGSLENYLLSVDEDAIVVTSLNVRIGQILALERMAVFNGAEAKLLALHMEHLSVLVLQREHCGIAVGRLSRPKLRILGRKFHGSIVSLNGRGLALSSLFPVGVD